MASSRDTSNGPVGKDIQLAWEAFEAMDGVHLELKAVSVLTKGLADIRWTMEAWPEDERSRGVQPLVSASVTYLAGWHKNLEALIFYLLYQLDFQLAEQEWKKTESAG